MSSTAIKPMVSVLSARKIFPVRSERQQRPNFTASSEEPWLQFRKLNDSIAYLHIKTFAGSLKSKFDSAYREILPIITATPNLILDLRDNGGGSDACWQKLREVIYTKPYAFNRTEMLCTAETIQRETERLAIMQKQSADYGKGAIRAAKRRIRYMSSAKPGSFVALSDFIPSLAKPFIHGNHYKQKKLYTFPSRVVLIFNRVSASAAEGLISTAMKSDKVITIGRKFKRRYYVWKCTHRKYAFRLGSLQFNSTHTSTF